MSAASLKLLETWSLQNMKSQRQQLKWSYHILQELPVLVIVTLHIVCRQKVAVEETSRTLSFNSVLIAQKAKVHRY